MFAYEKPKQKQGPKSPIQKKESEKAVTSSYLTDISGAMKMRFENTSGCSFDDVRVHYNSDKPTQFQALEYTQDKEANLTTKQERYLGHIVQKMDNGDDWEIAGSKKRKGKRMSKTEKDDIERYVSDWTDIDGQSNEENARDHYDRHGGDLGFVDFLQSASETLLSAKTGLFTPRDPTGISVRILGAKKYNIGGFFIITFGGKIYSFGVSDS